MATVNVSAPNTEQLVFGRLLTSTARRRDLTAGLVRAHLRDTPESALVRHEWSTVKGNLTLTPTPAVGSIAFTSNPAAGTALTLGARVITFVAGGPGAFQVQIGADLPATLASLAAFLNASADPTLDALVFTINGNALGIATQATGPLANGMALATTVSGATLSGPSLGGGGIVVTLAMAEADAGRFLGSYAYDVRHEPPDGSDAVLYGGTITFTQGVTRL
ncbi:hypothetical protein [Methylobacterium sp. CCH5-D2]|uniref:hypothetical protein n=1 Tax=Methylobacterium sp. CCH5-D2 TaxID=1768765 RepID=UPI00082A13A1|nr:hypothetical protein [Methylobacterium sp. CCH5-D2]